MNNLNFDPVLVAESYNDYLENAKNAGNDEIYQTKADKIECALWEGQSLDGELTAEDIMDEIINAMDFRGAELRELITAKDDITLLRAARELREWLNCKAEALIDDY